MHPRRVLVELSTAADSSTNVAVRVKSPLKEESLEKPKLSKAHALPRNWIR